MNVLVPIDFSECSDAALRRALDLASRLDGKVTLLNVIDTSPFLVTTQESYVDLMGLTREFRTKSQAALDDLATRADPEGRTIAARVVHEGRAAQAIVDCAREMAFDLIVIGTHGRTGLSRFFLGSVAERVVRLAPCDVLVVHPGDR